MSETTHVSPLLDGFALGNPIREHKGIRCHPAIKENSDKKYIVKVISIPASQVQMDALLLAGAYKDPSDAMDYFRGQAEDVMKEAALLKNLSKLEGFLSYEGWQMEPITRHRLGYEVYLLGSYKRSFAHPEATKTCCKNSKPRCCHNNSGYMALPRHKPIHDTARRKL